MAINETLQLTQAIPENRVLILLFGFFVLFMIIQNIGILSVAKLTKSKLTASYWMFVFGWDLASAILFWVIVANLEKILLLI